jgi:hypothetical protein
MTTKNLALAASITTLGQHNYAAVYHHKSFEFGEGRAADGPWSARATAVASGSRARTSYSSVGRPSGAASS